MMARDRFVRRLGLAAVLSLLVALPAVAQTPAAAGQENRPLKIGVINGERVLAESNIGAQVSQEAQAAATEWDTRISAKQSEIDTLVAQAQEQRLTLTDEALARMQQQIEQLNVDLTRLRDDAQRAMNRLPLARPTRVRSVRSRARMNW